MRPYPPPPRCLPRSSGLISSLLCIPKTPIGISSRPASCFSSSSSCSSVSSLTSTASTASSPSSSSVSLIRRNIISINPSKRINNTRAGVAAAAAANFSTSTTTMAASNTTFDVPKTMAGVQIEKTGGTEVLQYKTDLAVPVPKEGEVLVKNEVLGINYIDTYFRTGLYPAPSFPYILGREAAGTVVSLGPNTTCPTLQPGTRVAWMGTSAYAEYTAVPILHIAPIPSSPSSHISSEIAAASILQGLTALTMIRESHPVKAGDWVLVHAAAGGVGLWLVQLLKAVGAHTIATASTEEKRRIAAEAGADVVIGYNNGSQKEGEKQDEDGVLKRVLEVTDGKGVVAVFDGVGKATFESSLACVARKGTMVSFGNASGAVPPFTIARLAQKNIKLLRPTLFGYLATPQEFEAYTSQLFDLISKDKIDVRIHKTYSLKDVAQAHQDLEGRKTMGKLLLKL